MQIRKEDSMEKLENLIFNEEEVETHLIDLEEFDKSQLETEVTLQENSYAVEIDDYEVVL
jgi:hypothetical protein